MLKRILIASLVALLVLVGVGICGAEVTLEVWDWHYGAGQPAGEALERLDNLFMERNPDVKIKHVGQPHTNYYEIWTAAASAQRGPDVVMLHANALYFTDYKDVLLTLDDYISSWKDEVHGWAWMDTAINKDARQGVKGVPFTIQGNLFYYNKSLFAEAGLDPTIPPTQWDAFLEYCEKLRTTGVTPQGFGNKEGWHFDWYVRMFMASALGPDGLAKFASGEVKWTDPRVVKATEMVYELYERSYFNEDGPNLPLFMDAGDLFKSEQVAIFCGLASDIFCWKDFGEVLGLDNLGLFRNVNYEEAEYKDVFCANAGTGYGITNWCSNPEEAVDYLRFLVSLEAAELFFDIAGGLSSSSKLDISAIEIVQAQEILSWFKGSVFSYYGAFAPTELTQLFLRNAQLMFTGDMSPQEVCQSVQEEADRFFEKR